MTDDYTKAVMDSLSSESDERLAEIASEQEPGAWTSTAIACARQILRERGLPVPVGSAEAPSKDEQQANTRRANPPGPMLFGLIPIILLLLLKATMSFALGPEHVREKKLQDQLRANELKVFDDLVGLRMLRSEDKYSVASIEREAAGLDRQAQEIWDSIPVGEVIAKDGAGGFREVGKNVDVQSLRREAARSRDSAVETKRRIAKRMGFLLGKTSTSSLWKQHERIRAELKALHDSHRWYYGRTPWRSVLSGVSSVAYVLMVPAVLLSIGGAVWVLKWLAAEIGLA